MATETNPTEQLFPDVIKLFNLQHAHRLLVYFLGRPDNQLRAPALEAVMRNARNVHPQYLPQFYQMLSSLVSALLAYIKWEESCTLSGAYRKDLDVAQKKLVRIICQLESGDGNQVVRILQGMLKTST